MPALTVFTYTQIENIMLGLNEYLSSVRMAENNLKLYAYLLIQPEPNEKINLIVLWIYFIFRHNINPQVIILFTRHISESLILYKAKISKISIYIKLTFLS